MGAASESKMTVGLTCDVEFGWVLKHFWVTIGRSDTKVQVGTVRDFVTTECDRFSGFPVAELVGGAEAEDLFDGAVDEGYVILQ